MCGRYFKYNRDFPEKTVDICPSEETGVILFRNNTFVYESMLWGFIPRGKGGLIINARAETALERPMFAESVRRRRCIIEAAGYYEWNKSRQKASFTSMNKQKLYMAGCYRHDSGAAHFVIITTAANESVTTVHDRMPLILTGEESKMWLREDGAVEFLLHREPGPLQKFMEYEQEELHFL